MPCVLAPKRNVLQRFSLQFFILVFPNLVTRNNQNLGMLCNVSIPKGVGGWFPVKARFHVWFREDFCALTLA